MPCATKSAAISVKVSAPLLVSAPPATTVKTPVKVTVLLPPIINLAPLAILPVVPKLTELVPASVNVPAVQLRVLVTVNAADKVSVTELLTVSDLIVVAASMVGANIVPPEIVTSSPLFGTLPDDQFVARLQLALLPPDQLTDPA